MDERAIAIVRDYAIEHLDQLDAYKKFENRAIPEKNGGGQG